MTTPHEHRYVRGICRICGDEDGKVLHAKADEHISVEGDGKTTARPEEPPPSPPNALPVWDSLAVQLGWDRPAFTEMAKVNVCAVPVDVVYMMLQCDDCKADMQACGMTMADNGPRWLYTCPSCGKGGVTDRQFPFPNYQNKGRIQTPTQNFRHPNRGPNGRHR